VHLDDVDQIYNIVNVTQYRWANEWMSEFWMSEL
jgi:hypothetical protein